MNLRARCLRAILAGHRTVDAIATHLHEPQKQVCDAIMGLRKMGRIQRTPESADARVAVYEPIAGAVPYSPPRPRGLQKSAAQLLAACWRGANADPS